MFLVVFGLSLSSAWGNGQVTTLRGLLGELARQGHRVRFYERDLPYYRHHRDGLDFSPVELVLYSDWNEVRRDALTVVTSADVVLFTSFCPQGARIQAECFGRGCDCLIFYDLDTPVTLAGMRQREARILDYLLPEHIPRFAHYFSFSGGPILEELRRQWSARACHALYLGVDPQFFQRTPPRPEFACQLGFVGTYAADRQGKLERNLLAPARQHPEWRFLLAGAQYPPTLMLPANLAVYEHLRPAELPQFYSSCDWVLNLTRGDMCAAGYSPSARLFEAAACGAALLSDCWPGLETFFQPGEEIEVLEAGKDLVAILRQSESRRRAMGERARQKVLEEHSLAVRSRQLLAVLAA